MTSMPAPDPSRPSVVRRVFAPVQAGAIAGGGSALGLAAAIAVDSVPGHTIPTAIWVAITAGACTAAVLRGYPEEPKPPPILQRVLTVAVFGFVLGGLPISYIVDHFARPREDSEAITALLVTFAALLALGLWGRLSSSLGARLDDAARDVAPGAAIADEPPPVLDAREVESDALAVEVRVLWGADPLRVTHLSPPRDFIAGDAGDLLIDAAPLGASRWPIVIARGETASVIAPRGATGMIHRQDRRVTLDQAIGEGLASPYEGAPEAQAIPLDLGARVTLSLPLRAPRAAYRASHDGREIADAPLVIELAMVRAGRAVGRRPYFEGVGRAAFSAACALAIVVALRAWNPMQIPACTGDCDEDHADARVFMSRQLVAAQEHEEERRQELAAEDAADPDAVVLRPTWMLREPPPVRERSVLRFSEHWRDGTFRPDRPLEIPADMELVNPRAFCWDDSAPLDDEDFVTFPSVLRMLCASPQLSPFGMRVLGPPPNVDVLGRDPNDFWSPRYARALAAAPRVPLTGSARLDVAIARTTSGLDPAPLERLLVARRAALRDCHALGRRHQPEHDLTFTLGFVVGADGVITTASARDVEGSAGDRVARCITAALVGAELSPRLGRVANADVRVSLRARP